MKREYDHKEVSRLAGVSESQVLYWARTGLIPPAHRKGRLLYFDFQALAAFRTVKELLGKGITIRRIKRALKKLRAIDPGVGSLKEAHLTAEGGNLVLKRGGRTVSPEGQLLLDFKTPSPPLPLRPEPDVGESLFFRALTLEEGERWREAKRTYEKLLALDPAHVDALVNLGNIEKRLSDTFASERLYRKALLLDPDHAEANFNLANLLEEKGDLQNALLFYRKALHEEPDFAESCFNLARLLDVLGKKEEARGFWLRYLELDPESPWAEYARSRLEG